MSDLSMAFGAMQAAIKEDPELAWSWHCNIAMASVDEGMKIDSANRAAARVMHSCFGVDTSKNKHYDSALRNAAETITSRITPMPYVY